VPSLPKLPAIRLTVVEERDSDMSGFVNVRRLGLRATYPDGSQSKTFAYDAVTRRALDAVVICAFYTEAGKHHVYLRSCVRPPLALRPVTHGGEPEDGSMWELPAGLIEPGETPAEAAARETEEELGFGVDAKDIVALGNRMAPAPAVIGEYHHFVMCRVRPNARKEPSLDGSPLEHGGEVIAVAMDDAMSMIRAGLFADEKTELGLRRLRDALESP
jgi:8-oxo-dGTP pyrophosphatase MutT (NUDIX family)